MDKKTDIRRKRERRRLRASVFLRRNGLYIAAAICLAMLGGISALILGGADKKPGAPAESSLDERLSEAAVTLPPSGANSTAIPQRPTARPLPTATPAPTAAPTVMPDLTPAPSQTAAPGPTGWNSPVDGRLIRVFASDSLIWSKTLKQWMTHPGVDIAAPKGSEVRTAAPGTVEEVRDDDMLGTVVTVLHEGNVRTVYAGLKKETPVKAGDKLGQRALIGYIGDTAISECAEESHLHFELWLNEIPVDPENYVLIAKNG